MTLFQAQQALLRREMDIGKGGVSVAPYPIELEPPFRPFKHPSGVRETQQQREIPRPRRVSPPTAPSFVRVRLSQDDKYSLEANEQLLLAMGRRDITSFEMVGTAGKVYIQYATQTTEAPFLIAQLRSIFPRAQVFQADDALAISPWPSLFAKSFRLRDSNLFQIRTEARADPLVPLAAVLARTADGEVGMLQVLFHPVAHPWRENILTLASDPWDPSRSAFIDLKDLPQKARAKAERPLFAVALRLAASSSTALDSMASGFLPQFESLENGFVQAGEGYPTDAVLGRFARSTGMVLNVRELAALSHLPHPGSVPGLERASKTAPAPDIARHHILVPLGENNHSGERLDTGIPQERLVRHLSILGGTGMGKTNLMKHAFSSLLEAGYGMAVIDPKGELAYGILDLVPRHRVNDVIWFDPTDREFPPSLNILQASESVEPEDLAAELIIGLKRLMPNSLRVGQRTETVLRNTLTTLLSSEGEKTLNDVGYFLEDEEYRESVLTTVKSRELVAYWTRRRLTRNVVEPVITRLSGFLDRQSMRNIVGVPNKIDLQRAMAERKIFIANLHKGVLRDGAFVMGSLLLSRLQLQAMGRPVDDRPVYPILVDEFHEFAGHGTDAESLVTFLSETRSFNVPLVVSTQYLGRINRSVVQAMLGNLGTQVCMNMSPDDAHLLQRELGEFDATDLLNLDIGEAIVRMGRAIDSFNLKIPLVGDGQTFRDEIIARSRQIYCRTRDEAEKIVSGMHDEPEPKESEDSTPQVWVVDSGGVVYRSEDGPRPAAESGPESEVQVEEKSEAKTADTADTAATRSSPYSRELVTYIEHAAEWPFMPVSDRDKELGLSRYKSDKLRKELVEANLIRPHKVNTGRRSGQKVIIEVTEAGHLLLNSIGIHTTRPRGRGGFPHRYYAHMLKEYAEGRWAGCVATVEDGSYGRPADLTVKVPPATAGAKERLIAFEVFITGEEKELTGIVKDVDIFERVIVCAVSQSELESLARRARRSLGDELLKKVDFSLVSEYIGTARSDRNKTTRDPGPSVSPKPGKAASKIDDQVLIPKSEVEKNGPKSALELEGEIRSPRARRRRTKKGRLQQIEEAYTHLNDLDWLNESELIKIPEIIDRVDPMQVMPEGKALREVLLEAASQVLQDISGVPDKSSIHYFLNEYINGKSVAQIAKELGVTRSWCSRAYRKEAFRLTSTQFVKLIMMENA